MMYSVSRNPASAAERATRHDLEPSIVATSASSKPTVASSGHSQPGHLSSQPQPGRLKLLCNRYTPVPSQNEMEHTKLACAKASENSSWFTAFTFWLGGSRGFCQGEASPNQGITVCGKQEALQKEHMAILITSKQGFARSHTPSIKTPRLTGLFF